MAKIKKGTYSVKQELVCNDQGCVLRNRVITGPYRDLVFDTPVPTPGLSAEEKQEESTLERHRDTCIAYLKAKVAPLDSNDALEAETGLDYVEEYAAMYDRLNTTNWHYYFRGGDFNRAQLYEDFLKFRNIREEYRVGQKRAGRQ